MAIVWVHNPDWLTTADLPLVFQDVDPAVAVTLGGYGGTKGLTASSPALVKKALQIDDPTEFAMGCRFKASGNPSAPIVILGVVDTALQVQCVVALEPTRKLSVYRGNLEDGPIAMAGSVVPLHTWCRLGFTGWIRPTDGEVQVLRDSATQIQVGGIPTTWPSGAAPWQGGIVIGLAPEIVSGHYYVSDVALPGWAPLLADLLVGVQRPDADGRYTDFTPVGAPSVPEAIDDTTQDADTTYATTGDVTTVRRLSVTLAPPITADKVYGLQTSVIAKAIDATDNDRRAVVITPLEGAVVGGRAFFLSDSYGLVWAMESRSPVTDSRWTVGEANDAEAGIRIGPD